jgi:ribosomal protein L37E
LKQPNTDELCRTCGKESETIQHYCSMWASNTYRVRKETWWSSKSYPSETGRSSWID